MRFPQDKEWLLLISGRSALPALNLLVSILITLISATSLMFRIAINYLLALRALRVTINKQRKSAVGQQLLSLYVFITHFQTLSF